MMMQDAKRGRGFCLIDPHGDLASTIYENLPEHRKGDVTYLNVPKVHQAPIVYGYNPLRYVREDKRSLAAAGVLAVFKHMWADSWGVRMEHILRNTILTLMEVKGSNLTDILRLLKIKSYREDVVSKITNPQLKYFWEHEYDKYSYPFRQTAIAPIENKVGAFLTDPTVRRVLVNPDVDISFRRVMDESGILLVNLSKGEIGEDAAGLLGGLLVTTLGLAAFSRVDTPEPCRTPFHLYLDEFQNFTTLSMAHMASELRKFGCGLILSHQYLDQIEPAIREAVIGNCGTLISFRLGAKDARYIAQEFAPTFSASDITSLPNYHIYLKLMIDGAPSVSFSAKTLSRSNTCA